MKSAAQQNLKDEFITVSGLSTRYTEKGDGPAVLLIHGASLGSSLDVWHRNLAPLSAGGLCVIAYDQPGFGLSDDPPDWGLNFRTSFILKFMDALGIKSAALVGHSQSGAMAVEIALSHPDRVNAVVALGTGSLLPPLPDQPAKHRGPVEGGEGSDTEPTISDIKALLEHNLYNHALITGAEVDLRHRLSTGKNHHAFLSRKRSASAKGSAAKNAAGKPLWQRLSEVRQPLLMMYGREDRGEAAKRAEIAKQLYPNLSIHVVPGCKHLVQWDAEEAFHRVAGPFLRKSALSLPSSN